MVLFLKAKLDAPDTSTNKDDDNLETHDQTGIKREMVIMMRLKTRPVLILDIGDNVNTSDICRDPTFAQHVTTYTAISGIPGVLFD